MCNISLSAIVANRRWNKDYFEEKEIKKKNLIKYTWKVKERISLLSARD